MSGSRLPKEQELQLMKMLSSDDDYRGRYEKNPADALKEIGVTDEQISALDPAALQPGKLAEKADIVTAHGKLIAAKNSEHVCLIIPMLRLNYGDSGSDKTV